MRSRSRQRCCSGRDRLKCLLCVVRFSLSRDLVAWHCFCSTWYGYRLAWYSCRSHVVSLRGTAIALTWSQCMVRLSCSRGLVAWCGYYPHVVSFHRAVIALTWSHCMIRLFAITCGLIARYGYRSHVVHRPIKMEKMAELRELGLFPLMATCTHAKTPTMLAGISLDKRRAV